MAELAAMPKYDAYKDSGVDWLGNIPAKWNIKKFNFLLKEVNVRSKTGEEQLLSLSKYRGVVLKKSLEERAGGAASLIGYKKVSKNDLVINKMQAINGLLSVSSIEGITSPDYSVYRPQDTNILNVNYLGYLLMQPEYLAEFKRRVSGVMEGFIRLYTDDLYAIPSILPDIETQKSISYFLDKKTTQIGEAIAIKEKQIDLLKERKQIIIQKAVTQGLNPNVPMKDSGVDWIGQIPEHWKTMALRYAFKFMNNKRLPLSAVEREDRHGVYPYYGASGIIDYVDDYLFEEDLILIAEDGANLLSKSTPLAFVATGKYWVNNHAHIIKPNFEGFRYWAELLSSFDYTVYVTGAAQPKLTRENLGSIIVPVPPKGEIATIIKYIERIVPDIDQTLSLQLEQIEKLKEYKTTLINSAVTGKIKVA